MRLAEMNRSTQPYCLGCRPAESQSGYTSARSDHARQIAQAHRSSNPQRNAKLKSAWRSKPCSAPFRKSRRLLDKLKLGVQKTRAGLVSALEDAISGRKIDADLLEELEYTLLSADIGVATTTEILDRIRERVERHQLNDAGELRGLIKQHLLEILEASERPLPHVAEPRPSSWWSA